MSHPVPHPANVTWFPGSPDAAFALAAARGVPLFLYWGASWCPPCNRIRATVFARSDFQLLAGACVAVHLDGDSAGAQQLAERLRLRSYPTLVVYRPDGAEITRLPCELDGERLVQVMTLALAAPCPVAESLRAALAYQRALSDDEWQLLSFYAWDTDERQVLGELELAATLVGLARASTLPSAARRLHWLALHAAATAGKGGVDQRSAVRQLEDTLRDETAVRAQMDLVIHQAVDLVRFLTVPQSAARLQLTQLWANALAGLETHPTLALADRLAALRTRVRLARLGAPVEGLEPLARARVAEALASAAGPALRHQLVNTAAGVLSDAGLLDAADQVLLDELPRAHAPYYFMHNLAAIAKQRGDRVNAVRWYERAWDGASGAATRLQWGALYLQSLIDFAPQDVARIDQVAGALLDHIGSLPDADCQRNRTQLERIGAKLAIWNGASGNAAALRQRASAARPA